MIGGLKPYPLMKTSGVRWLGDMPEHWEVQKLRSMLQPITERDRPNLPLLSVVREKGVIRRDPTMTDENRNFIPEDLSNYKVVRAGQFAMNKMKAWQGSYGVSRFDGIVSPAYFVFDLSGLQSDFFHSAVRSRAYVPFFAQASDGVRIGQWDLSQNRMKDIPFFVPPITEQRAIVRFLAYVDRRLRHYVHTKQRLVQLLEEERRALIFRAVRRGLETEVRLKPTGAPWLGNVPEHWDITRVKNEFICLNRLRVPLSATQRATMTLRLYDYYGASSVIDRVENFIFDDELLLIAEDGANLVLRNLPLAVVARGRFWVNNHAHILKPRRGNLEFMANLMESVNYLPWISGAAQPKLTKDRLLGIVIAVPPRNEQDRIMAWLDAETLPWNTAIDRARREIRLLREYSTSLTADLVTGHVDVREAAVALPEQTDEQEPPEEEVEVSDQLPEREGEITEVAPYEVEA